MSGKGPHYPQYSNDNISIHYLLIYSGVIEYNFVGDRNIPLFRCYFFISKEINGDIIPTGQNKNYQSFKKLQF